MPPRLAHVLKQDTFGRVELLESASGSCVRRVACGGKLWGSRAVARMLLRRERRALAALEGLPGVPEIVQDEAWYQAHSQDGKPPLLHDCLVRTHLEGVPLSRAQALPMDFFARLSDLVASLHARGVCHNDLHKEQNILVGPDGWPSVIDFQLASVHALGDRSLHARAREDLRHVSKHERRYTKAGRAPNEISRAAAAPRVPRSIQAWVWRRLFKPLYNALTGPFHVRGSGEVRRPSSGPWPTWQAPLQGPRSKA